MTTKDNGGPAFPHSRLGSDADGMTLRDYFAAKAMMGFVDFGTLSDDEYFINGATAAYKMADAMLEARKK